MRKAVLLALALVALAAPAAAQPPLFTEAYQVRGGFGDIPTTPAAEPTGAWNLVQSLRIAHTEGTATNATLHVPPGYAVVAPGCSCPAFDSTESPGAVTIQVPAETPSGDVTVSLSVTATVGDAFGFTLILPEGASPTDALVVLYVPVGSEAVGPVDSTSPGLSTDGASRITLFQGTAEAPMPLVPSFVVAPVGTLVAPPVATPAAPAEEGFAWLELGLGLAVGVALWALLVQRGIVQRKSRRQSVAVAAHVEAAQNEPRPVLEGRKRALLAALKELELARQAQEIPVEAYDAVKADLKRQAVTVMRALETGEGTAKPEA